MMCLAGGIPSMAQTVTETTPLNDLIPLPEQSVNYEDRYESLAQLLTQQFDINKVSREELQLIPGLPEEAINALLSYRESRGPFLSVYELQTLNAWDHSLFNKVKPFLFVVEVQSNLNSSILKRIKSEPNNYLIIRWDRTLESKKGYVPDGSTRTKYAGSPDHYYMRFRTARQGDFSLGFTMEKDPGESLVWNPSQQQYGADFFSFHVQVLEKRRWKNIILGDFQAQFGQGIALGSVFGFGKNSEAITTIRRSSLGFMPYTSVQENQLFRGMAGSYMASKHLTIHAFISSQAIDGQAKSDTTESLPSSGLHRTGSEILLRKTINRRDAGAVFQIKHKRLELGMMWQGTMFDKSIVQPPNPYNQFSFAGNQNQNAGLFGSAGIGQALLFGEWSYTTGHGHALNMGTLVAVSPSFEMSLHYRYYGRDFHSFYSNAFSESTSPQNEEGIYWGWKYSLSKALVLTGYADLFSFPWLRYRDYRPSQGKEILVRLNIATRKKLQAFVQFREEEKSRNIGTGAVYMQAQGTRRNFWLNADYPVNEHLRLKTRLQYNQFQIGATTTSGIGLFQDFILTMRRMSLSVRYALFDTDFENRAYTYEPDVWMSFSYPAYEGVGVRTSMILQYDLTRKINLSVRWARTMFTDREVIGSGTEEIKGNTRNDVKFQARISF